MITVTIENQKNIIRNYIRAKDDNKPHLMKSAFTDSATLKMAVKTDSISFPADSVGLDAITDVLVRNFSQSYENVYTFCLTDSFNSQKESASCNWLVFMTERDSGNVRAGVGRYDWHFDDKNTLVDGATNNLAKSLLITIEQMLVLTAANSDLLLNWARELPYPFCDSKQLLELMPDLDSLVSIRRFVNQNSIY